jgi:hypothetical protein
LGSHRASRRSGRNQQSADEERAGRFCNVAQGSSFVVEYRAERLSFLRSHARAFTRFGEGDALRAVRRR